MLYTNNLSWSNLFNNLKKVWLLLSILFLLFFCKLKSENNNKKKLKTIRALHELHASSFFLMLEAHDFLSDLYFLILIL
jgi:hypothetical protein